MSLKASASGILVPAAVAFVPTLNAPVYTANSGSPSSVVVGSSPPDVQLIATSGTGSTGSATFTESGWTNAPYDQTLGAAATPVCVHGTSFASYATVSPVASGSAGTVITVTVISSPAAGECALTVSDGVTANSTDATATLNTSYTSSSIGVNGRPHRR